MSRNPDPCYCEQAQAYEDLLNRVLDFLSNPHSERFAYYISHPSGKGETTGLALLKEDITKTIGEYQTAQEEYVDE